VHTDCILREPVQDRARVLNFAEPVAKCLKHLTLHLRVWIVKVRMKQALENLLGNLMHGNRNIIPCICNKFHGVNNDDLGNLSGRFIED